MPQVTVTYKKDESVHDMTQCMKLDDEYDKVSELFAGKATVAKEEAPGPSYFEVHIRDGEGNEAMLFSKHNLQRFPKRNEVAKNLARFESGETGDIYALAAQKSGGGGGCILQ
jgi:uncharacterized protein YrzB (UPF0473 family)